MRRTTISLPDDVAAHLEREARRRRVPVSQFVREALEVYLARPQASPHRYSLIGLFASGETDVAENFEQYHAEVVEADPEYRDRDR